MRKRRKLLLVATIVSLLGVVVWTYVARNAMVEGESWSEKVGGMWEVEYHSSPLGHSGATARLSRRRRDHLTIVEPSVSSVLHLGDDCVAYARSRRGKGPEFLAVCGDRQPLVVVAASFKEWAIEPRGLVRYAALGDRRVVDLVPVGEMKRRALAQPLSQ